MSVPVEVVNSILENLAELLIYHHSLVAKQENGIRVLYRELELLAGLMMDFAKYNHDNTYLKGFVKQIKSVVDPAEDAVDAYVFRIAIQKSRSWIPKFFHVDYPIKLWYLGKQIQKTSNAIKKVHQETARNSFEVLKSEVLNLGSRPAESKKVIPTTNTAHPSPPNPKKNPLFV